MASQRLGREEEVVLRREAGGCLSGWDVGPGGGQGQEVALHPTVLCWCLQHWWLELPRQRVWACL